ncbi:MAG: flagellar biosynthetic protein FliO [Methylophaga sp.]|nr:MAG: flagellar biosynthetic protein FliO [Methylophaga sp.]
MKQNLIQYVTLLAFSLCSPVCLALESNDKAVMARTLSSDPISTGTLLQTLLGLLVVLACIVLLAWLLKRSGRFQSSTNSDLQTLASITLGPHERAVLLQVGKQQILVGVTAHNVQTLHLLEEPIETQSPSVPASNFAAKLQQIMQQRSAS